MGQLASDDELTATVEYRARFDEAGQSGTVGPAWFVRIAQDAAWIHAERLGFTRSRYATEGLVWLVRAVALTVHDPVGHGERVEVTTWIAGYRRIWARRLTTISRDARPVADVATDWILVGRDGRPLRIPADVIDRIPGDGGLIDPIRVAAGAGPPDALETEDLIRAVELDPLGHVNNAAYIDRMMATVGRLAPEPSSAMLERPSIRIEYASAAGPDQPIREHVWPLADGLGVAYRMVALDGAEVVRASLSTTG